MARNHARAADVSQKAEERAAAAVATSVTTAAKCLGRGLLGGEGAISSYFPVT